MGDQHNDTIDDKITIVLTIDSQHAMAAAVALRSIAENVQGEVTLYVVDCGLVGQDKQKIERSLPTRPGLAIHFMNLAPDAIASKLGPSWARVDTMKYLPVKRAIYLDADILVRKDLRALWNTDLQGHPLAAVLDIPRRRGVRPNGCFNSGVLLMDLTKTRSAFPELERRCYEGGSSEFHEQDPLNAQFKDDWVALDLGCNAQGLGTYARWVNADQRMSSEGMNDPAIVHFTGPVHPPMGAVLDFFQQPVTAKPWGYMGAPGHPYERDWWDTLDRTAWRGQKETDEYKNGCEKARANILKTEREEFEKWVELRERIRYL